LGVLDHRKLFYQKRSVDATEAIGFHGTSIQAASAILRLGFRQIKAKPTTT
jgi:hypothetical protein